MGAGSLDVDGDLPPSAKFVAHVLLREGPLTRASNATRPGCVRAPFEKRPTRSSIVVSSRKTSIPTTSDSACIGTFRFASAVNHTENITVYHGYSRFGCTF